MVGVKSSYGIAASAALRNDGTPIGLRERHKIDKLQRISSAAIALFGRDGYDGTTLRDIAAEAGVALGTLSLYARDKRDLVLMIFNKVIPPLMERGQRNTDPEASLAENLVAFFAPFYSAFAEDSTLYRVVLGQIYNGPSGMHADINDTIRLELLGHLTDIIRGAMAGGRCRDDADAVLQARSFFYLYFAAVRVWLFQPEPDPARGLADLKILYELHMDGLRAAR